MPKEKVRSQGSRSTEFAPLNSLPFFLIWRGVSRHPVIFPTLRESRTVHFIKIINYFHWHSFRRLEAKDQFVEQISSKLRFFTWKVLPGPDNTGPSSIVGLVEVLRRNPVYRAALKTYTGTFPLRLKRESGIREREKLSPYDRQRLKWM